MDGVLVVTGAGRGIGASIARLGAARGLAVCVNYARNREAAQAVVAGIVATGGRAIAVQADVADRDEARRLFETVDRELGMVTALVNNAGILEQQMRVDQMDAARLHRVLAANVVGSFLCCREAVRRMSTPHGGKGGAILNISSMAAVLGGLPHEVPYAASKGGLDSFTVGLSREVAMEGIRVNGIRPGLIDTPIHDQYHGPGFATSFAANLPMKRAGTSEEVAAAALWLLSPPASYVTGAILHVSGGR